MNEIQIDQVVEEFNSQGFCILRSLLPLSVVRRARSELETLVEERAQEFAAAGKIDSTFGEDPFETRFYRLYEKHPDEAPSDFRAELHLEGFFDVFFFPPILDLVERLVGAEVRIYPNYTVRPKLPDHARTLVLWHQDGGYTEHWHKHSEGKIVELKMVNLWTPLVPARVENGCMQFLAGTHRLELLPHVQREFYLEIPEEHIETLPNDIIDVELNPGDVVVFHNMLCHRGLTNQTQSIRWSVDWRYQDATQPTLRAQNGHLARSALSPDRVVRDAADWASRSFE